MDYLKNHTIWSLSFIQQTVITVSIFVIVLFNYSNVFIEIFLLVFLTYVFLIVVKLCLVQLESATVSKFVVSFGICR